MVRLSSKIHFFMCANLLKMIPVLWVSDNKISWLSSGLNTFISFINISLIFPDFSQFYENCYNPDFEPMIYSTTGSMTSFLSWLSVWGTGCKSWLNTDFHLLYISSSVNRPRSLYAVYHSKFQISLSEFPLLKYINNSQFDFSGVWLTPNIL